MAHQETSPPNPESSRRAPVRLGSDTEGLTADLRSEASRRLRIMSIVTFGLFGVYFLWFHVIGPAIFASGEIRAMMPELNETRQLIAHVIIATGMLLSLGMFFLSRRKGVPDTQLLETGLVFEVLIALVIASGYSINRFDETGQVRKLGISWVCIWILLYPTIVPTSPRKAFLAAWASALMDPLATYVHGYLALGKILQPVTLLIFFDNYICAILAVLPAKIIAKLGEKVRREREMGSYQLMERIGKGGMGEVWRARHKLLARPAAIKIIRREALGDVDAAQANMTLKRFEREAQATAALQSPHSIEIFDFGLSNGTFYYVMELLEGFDLQTLVERFGPVESERAAVLLAQVCHSLYDAHQNGLIHRDVKPANIFVCRKGQDSDFVKVLDFGLVKSQALAGRDPTLATMQGVTTGTPAFMAPEQALEQSRVDHRADIYALGCVGYWLVSGQLLFEADSPMQMLVRHARDVPEPPSHRTENEIAPSLEGVILRCLEKDPAARPQSAKELESLIWNCQFSSRWTEARAEQWWQRHAPGSARAAEPPIPSLRRRAAAVPADARTDVRSRPSTRPVGPTDPHQLRERSRSRTRLPDASHGVESPEPDVPRGAPEATDAPAFFRGSRRPSPPPANDDAGPESLAGPARSRDR